MHRVNRLLRLIQIIQWGRPYTIDALSRELGVTRRTLFRDMRILERAGMPCTFDRKTQAYVFSRGRVLPPLSLTLDEALALTVQTRKALHSKVTPGHQAALSAALKIEAALPAELARHCGELLEAVDVRHWPMSDVASVGDTLAHLQQALADRRKVAVLYESYQEKGEISTVLHLYRLRFVRRGWYAIAFSEAHSELRTFKIERLLSVTSLDDHYEIDPTFNLETYYGNAWQMIRGDRPYHVVIRFSPKVAGNVEEVSWHKTQQTQRTDDDSLIFEVDVDGLSEIAWWVLGYGREAVVEQPQELRDLIAAHARAMLQHYAGDAREGS